MLTQSLRKSRAVQLALFVGGIGVAIAVLCAGSGVVEAADEVLDSEREEEAWERNYRKVIQERLAVLADESVEDSLEELDFVDWYYHSRWPEGSMPLGPPLPPTAGAYDLLRIEGNRRFRKVYHELSMMPRPEARKLLASHLEQSLAQYKTLYDRAWAVIDGSGVGDDRDNVGPSMIIGNGPEGVPTLIGSQLDVLGLVWIAANLKLEGARPQVESVLREALRQRDFSYGVEGELAFDAMVTLKRAGIYNREILAVAIIELTPDCDAMLQRITPPFMDGAGNGPVDLDEYRRVLREKKPYEVLPITYRLARYDADAISLNAFAAPVDWSKGSFDLKAASDVDDPTFNALLEYAGWSVGEQE